MIMQNSIRQKWIFQMYSTPISWQMTGGRLSDQHTFVSMSLWVGGAPVITSNYIHVAFAACCLCLNLMPQNCWCYFEFICSNCKHLLWHRRDLVVLVVVLETRNKNLKKYISYEIRPRIIFIESFLNVRIWKAYRQTVSYNSYDTKQGNNQYQT